MPNVYDHYALTAGRKRVAFHIHTDKYIGPITD